MKASAYPKEDREGRALMYMINSWPQTDERLFCGECAERRNLRPDLNYWPTRDHCCADCGRMPEGVAR